MATCIKASLQAGEVGVTCCGRGSSSSRLASACHSAVRSRAWASSTSSSLRQMEHLYKETAHLRSTALTAAMHAPAAGTLATAPGMPCA